jgi:hypothetical protein
MCLILIPVNADFWPSPGRASRPLGTAEDRPQRAGARAPVRERVQLSSQRDERASPGHINLEGFSRTLSRIDDCEDRNQSRSTRPVAVWVSAKFLAGVPTHHGRPRDVRFIDCPRTISHSGACGGFGDDSGGVVRSPFGLWCRRAETLRRDPERCIELAREVLKRDERSQLDNCVVVEMLPERNEVFRRRASIRVGDGFRVAKRRLLGRRETFTRLVPRELR